MKAIGLFNRYYMKPHIGRVAFNMHPTTGPWGGSSSFVLQLSSLLTRRGYDVCFSLKKPVDIIVLIDPRDDLANKAFGLREIVKYKEQNSGVRILHRVNECDKRKATNFMDALLAHANKIADYTVFISTWLKEYHTERWFNSSQPHSVIYNGADPCVFHPINSSSYTNSRPFRVVTHHWSDNPMKGFDVYQHVDELIAKGELKGVELWVVGRWPPVIQWRAAKVFTPTYGIDLANKLRSCHAYLTASRWEPCGMHHVEGAQCGLPLIYHEDGGGIVEAGKKYGIGFREDVKSAILEMKKRHTDYRQLLFKNMPSGDRMSLEYSEIIQYLISNVN